MNFVFQTTYAWVKITRIVLPIVFKFCRNQLTINILNYFWLTFCSHCQWWGPEVCKGVEYGLLYSYMHLQYLYNVTISDLWISSVSYIFIWLMCMSTSQCSNVRDWCKYHFVNGILICIWDNQLCLKNVAFYHS